MTIHDDLMREIENRSRRRKRFFKKEGNIIAHVQDEVTKVIDTFASQWELQKDDSSRAIFIDSLARNLEFKLSLIDMDCEIQFNWDNDEEDSLNKLYLKSIRIVWSSVFREKYQLAESINYDLMSRVFDNYLK